MKKSMLVLAVVAIVMVSLCSSASAEVRQVAEIGPEVLQGGYMPKVGGNILIFRNSKLLDTQLVTTISVYDFVQRRMLYQFSGNIEIDAISPDGHFVAWNEVKYFGLGKDSQSDIFVLDVAEGRIFALTPQARGYYSTFPTFGDSGELYWLEKIWLATGGVKYSIDSYNFNTGKREFTPEYFEEWDLDVNVEIFANGKWLVVLYQSYDQNMIEVFFLPNRKKEYVVDLDMPYGQRAMVTLSGDRLVTRPLENWGDLKYLDFLNLDSGEWETVRYDFEVFGIWGMDNQLLTYQRTDWTENGSGWCAYVGKYGAENLVNPYDDVVDYGLYAHGNTFLYQSQTLVADKDGIERWFDGPVKIFRDVEPAPAPSHHKKPVPGGGGGCFIGTLIG